MSRPQNWSKMMHDMFFSTYMDMANLSTFTVQGGVFLGN